MEELDLWTAVNVIDPLFFGAQSQEDEAPEDWEEVTKQVKRVVRTKVLESYRNGQAAGPRQPVQERRKVYQR